MIFGYFDFIEICLPSFYTSSIFANKYQNITDVPKIFMAIVVGENYNSLYVDGQNLQPDYYYNSSPAVGNVMWENVASISVGLSLMYSVGQFMGAIDDIRFYNRPLSDTEISQLYLIGN